MSALIRRLRACLRRDDEGAQLIEFVIVFPILMLILMGILDFGMLMRSLEVVTNAAREGARVAVLPGYDQGDVQVRVREYLNSAGMTDTVTTTLASAPVTTPAGTFTAQAVTVNYTYQMFMLSGASAFFGGGIGQVPLQASAVMRSEIQAAP